jgi:hypothetical protein
VTYTNCRVRGSIIVGFTAYRSLSESTVYHTTGIIVYSVHVYTQYNNTVYNSITVCFVLFIIKEEKTKKKRTRTLTLSHITAE